MSKGFNLTAELNLRGPSNVRTIVADIRRQVGSVSVNITPTVNRQSIRNVASTIRSQLANLVCDVKVRANAASLRSIGSDIRRQLGGVTANVNVRASQASVRNVASDIRRQLGSINTNISVRFNNSAVTAYSNNLRGLNNNLNQIAASATNATTAINNLTAAMRGAAAASSAINNAAVNVGNVGAAANRTRTNVALASNEMIEFGRQSGLAFRRFSAITTVTGVIYGLTNAISSGVKSFIDFDLQLTRIAQVTGDAKNKLGDVSDTITSLSTSLGVGSNELTKTTVTLAQAGLTAKETATALKALALSALAPSFDDMNQTVEGSIALMRQFGIGANQLEMALGSVNAVSAKFAVEASDIIAAIQRTGGVFAAASRGVSSGTDALNEFIAVFTSIRATTRESAETIATGLRTIFTRIQRTDTIEALKEFGVTLTDLEGKFVGPYIAVQRLSEGLSRLDSRDLKFSQIVEELGGFRQIGKVLPLIQQFSTAQDALKVAQQGQGSLATDAAKGQLALAIQIQKVREEFLALIRSIGDTSSFQNIVKVGLDLASALIKIADATKGVIPLLTMFAAFRGVSSAAQYIGGFGQGIRGRAARGSAEGGRIYAFASGGLVPGSGNNDSVAARLTPGEFVIKKSSVKSIGVNNLSKLNSGGRAEASVQVLANRSDNGPVITKFKKTSSNFIENNDKVYAIIRKQTFEDRGFGYKDYPVLTQELEKQGVRFPIGSKGGSSRGKFDARSGSIMETLLRNKMGRGARKYEGAPGYSDISNAPIDIIRGNSIYEVKFKSGSTSDNEILAKLLRYKLETKRNYRSVGFNENKPPQKDDVNLGTINLVHGENIGDVDGYKSDYIRWLKAQGKYRLNAGGFAQRLAQGGVAQRAVGYIDGDVLADPTNAEVVRSEMQRLGITDIHKYKKHLSDRAASARKAGDIKRLSLVHGVAGSGKSTFVKGGSRADEADNAKLRTTSRYPILTEADLLRSDQIVDSTSVVGPNQKPTLAASDRIVNLSTRLEESRNAVVANRKSRDKTGVGLFGRKPGATKGASLDSGSGEAYIAASEVSGADPRKVVTYAIGENFSKRRIGQPSVRSPERTMMYLGNFGPATAGHLQGAEYGSKKSKISPQDSVIVVAGDSSIDYKNPDEQQTRTAIFPQKSKTGPSRMGMAQAVFGSRGFNVAATPRGAGPGTIPNAFKVGKDSYIVPRGVSDVAIVGDEKDSKALGKYTNAGYSTLSMPRLGGISGTAARAAIIGNDTDKMRSLLTPEGFSYVQKYLDTLQKRPQLLDSILARLVKNSESGRGVSGRLSSVMSQLASLPARKTKSTPPETVSLMESLRKQRDDLNSKLGRRPSRMLERLEGLGIRKFAEAGSIGTRTGKPASRADILKVLKLNEAASAAGISSSDVYRVLGLRNPNEKEAAWQKAIKEAYLQKTEATKQDRQKRIGQLTAKGLAFGAAGMFGAAFPSVQKTLISPKLKNPVDVYITSGVMDPAEATRLDQTFSSSMAKTSRIAAKRLMVDDILRQVGLGKTINLDFDRTLALGADKILANPLQPKFAEFSDSVAVQGALKNSRLTLLGRELSQLVKSEPALLANLRVITARPAKTLGFIQNWLTSQGLPIPLSQFSGVGGPGISGSQIPALKAALLTKGSVFVDDDRANIREARRKGGIRTYRYGSGKIKKDANTEATAQGTLFEYLIQSLGGPKANKSFKSIDFPNGLKAAAKFFKIKPNIPTDAKRTLNGPSTVEDNIVNYLSAKGYNLGGHISRLASGGTVPALVSNGEAFVPPETARKIGYSTLNRMNQADRGGMGRFAAGGGISIFKGPGSGTSDSIGPVGLPVGGFVIRAAATKALGFDKGGSVQRFALGGSPRAIPDLTGRTDAEALTVVGVVDVVTNQLESLANVLQDLGVRSSESSRILQSGTQATYQQAIEAAEADIRRARLAGATAEQIVAAENQLANIRNQARQDIQTRRTLGSLSGTQLQQIESDAEQERNRNNQRRTNQLRRQGLSREEIETQLQTEAGDINRISYNTATRRQGINLAASGLSGDDAQRFIRQSMGDPRILRQMDQQIRAQAGTDTARLRVAEEEIRTRREIVNNLGRQRGQQTPGGDPTRSRFQSVLGLSFGLQGIGALAAQQLNANSSSANASTAGAIQGATSGLATGAMLTGGIQDMLGSRLSPVMSRLLGVFGGVITTVSAVGQAFIDARNATIEFEKNLQQKKLETALTDSQKLFEKLNTDIKNIDIQNSLTSKLAEAGEATKSGIETNNKLAKAFWANVIDVFVSQNQNEASQRSEILDKKGIMSYIRSTDIYAGGGLPDSRLGAQARSKEYESLIPEKARENSKSFAEVSKLTTDLIGAKIQSGSSIEDIFKDPAWSRQAEVIARSNTAVEQEILSIQNRADISNFEKDARIKNIISINAEESVRKQAAVISRQKQIKDLDNTTNIYTRSLERMFQNMEQSIGRASFSLEQMSKDIDLVSDSLQGQAKVGEVSLTAINALQNPRAYSETTVFNARNIAAESFGSRSPDMVSLLGVGEKIESTVMSTVNKAIKQNPGATDEAIGAIVSRDIKTALADLKLPPDLVDKLSDEVGSVLKDFKKSGEDKLDFNKLSEKLAQLNKVVDSSKRSQEVAIKALELYQNALNTYTQNINKTIDLQVSANQKLRKATDIVTDSELSLAKILGKNINLEKTRSTVNSRVAARTGGLTNPNDIFNSINKLETNRVTQQAAQRNAADKGLSGQADFIKLTKNIADTNVNLRENIDALKYLAENTDIAASAMEKIQEAQQKTSGRVSFIEKLVTSTPEELNSLSTAFQRLQNNANGQINTINRSVGAQRAYLDALQNGATMMEAMKAAQVAFVNERKETLGALNDILPFLGNSQQAGNVKANVLESMMRESGIGISPLFQQVLNTLRNPEMDPATQAAIAEYREGNNLQARANALLAQLDTNLANDIANKSSKALADTIKNVSLKFEASELKDIANNIQEINGKIPAPGIGAAPVGKASGGIIYASMGQAINFQPRGTDTVPAMLTPGEFVVNRAATQNNLPLLNAINSNKYSSGGQVRYYSTGGFVSTNFKDEYKKNNSQMSLSKREYIDNKNFDFVTTDWYSGPQSFVVGQPSSKIESPYRSGDKAKPSFGSLLNNENNKIYLGAAPSISIGNPPGNGNLFHYVGNDTQPVYNANLLGKVIVDKNEPNISKPFTKRKIAKAEYDRYKEDVLLLKAKLQGRLIESVNNIGFLEDIPKISINNNIYNPNIKTNKKIGVIQSQKSPEFQINEAAESSNQVIKIFQEYNSMEEAGSWLVAGLGSLAAGLAGTVGGGGVNIPLGVAAGAAAFGTIKYGTEAMNYNSLISSASNEQGFTRAAIPQSLRMSMRSADNSILGGTWISKKDDISNAIRYQKENISLYNETLKFIETNQNNNFDNEDTELTKLRISLQNSYNGAASSLIESKSIAKYFDTSFDKSGQKLSTLYILNNIYKNNLNKLSETKLKALKRSNSELSIGGADIPLGKDFDWAKGDPIGIQPLEGVAKSFPWVANAAPDNILTNFEEDKKTAIEKILADKKYNISEQFISENGKTFDITFPDPLGKVSIPYNMHYTKYSGQLVADEKTDAADKDEFGMHKKLRLDNIHLITPLKDDPLDPFAALTEKQVNIAGFSQYVKQPLVAQDIFEPMKLENISELKELIKGSPDPAKKRQLINKLESQHHQIDLNELVNIKNHPIFHNTRLFSSNLNEKSTYKFSIGQYLSNVAEKALKEKIDNASNITSTIDDKNQLSSDIVKDVDLPNKVKNLAKLSLGVFARRPVPGLPGAWLYNNIRGVLQRPFKDAGVAKQAAAYTSNVFNNFGAYLSKLAPMARNINVYQQLKELFTLGSGAAIAFAGLANNDTRMIKQFDNLNINPEDLFRSLGMGSLFGKISSTELPADYKAILGEQLDGAKIKTVGADGTLGAVAPNDAIPKKYIDLVNIAFNPYNEFPNKDTRKDIIKKLATDMVQSRDQAGATYFDSNTQRFLWKNMSALYDWYGGLGEWLGQDYFFDKDIDADNAKRTQAVIDSYRGQAGQTAYSQGNKAHNTLGFAYRYGNLPKEEWFVQRRIAGLEAESQPNKLNDLQRFPEHKRPQGLATGGMVYAAGGSLINFQPKGTDTVPAMLTPGEFVINAKATAQHLPLLKAINSGEYRYGGLISYLDIGGEAGKKQSKAEAHKVEMQRRKNAYQKEKDDRREAYENALRARSEAANYTQDQRRPDGQGGWMTGNTRIGHGNPINARGVGDNTVQNNMAPQTARAVSIAANAAFDQRNSGDVNKQLTIFGTLLTGVNQLLVQHGAILQQQMANNGAAMAGANGNQNRGNGGMVPQNANNPNGVNNNAGAGMDGLSDFTATFDKFIQQLNGLKLPEIINIEGNHKVEVTINGAAAFQGMTESVTKLVISQVNKAMNKLSSANEGVINIG